MVLPRSSARAPAKRLLAGSRNKIVHVIRHGEAQHNVSDKFLGKRETRLTAKGRLQARALRRLFPKLKAEVVITSPILRAMQTARAMAPKAATVVVPDARERILCPSHKCDLPVEAARFRSSKQFSGFDWTMAKGVGSPKYEKDIVDTDLASWANIRRRSRRLTRLLLERPEENLCVVSHGGFLMRLTNDKYMGNCEVRTYLVTGGRHPKWQLMKRVPSPCTGI